MWPKYVPVGEYNWEYAVCSCGFESPRSMWLDDVMLSDITPRHPNPYVVAYPEEAPDQSDGGVMVVIHGDPWPIGHANLEWLLAQPDLPDEFRRAAAVHLKP